VDQLVENIAGKIVCRLTYRQTVNNSLMPRLRIRMLRKPGNQACAS
jgi:hypothetical protein